jgi:hypothetical protein
MSDIHVLQAHGHDRHQAKEICGRSETLDVNPITNERRSGVSPGYRTHADKVRMQSPHRKQPLWVDAEGNVNAWVHRVAQVIHAVNIDDINVLRVEPVGGPRANKSERTAAALEAAITVVALADMERVFASKIGLATVVGNLEEVLR